jgi:hypothetical protein
MCNDKYLSYRKVSIDEASGALITPWIPYKALPDDEDDDDDDNDDDDDDDDV